VSWTRAKGSELTARHSFAGSWRIRKSALWLAKDLDLLGPALIRFGSHQLGELRLVAIQADLDYRIAMVGGTPRVEFSWQGFDDNDPACGRGWAQLEAEGLTGCLYIHRGDDSTFWAVRSSEDQLKGTPRSPRKVVREDEAVPVAFTEADRRLITDHTAADPEYMSRLRPAGKGRSGLSGLFTLYDLEDLTGYIAAEANHTDDKRLASRLHRLFGRLTETMESYDDGNWQGSF
jgi:hypothetical protein